MFRWHLNWLTRQQMIGQVVVKAVRWSLRQNHLLDGRSIRLFAIRLHMADQAQIGRHFRWWNFVRIEVAQFIDVVGCDVSPLADDRARCAQHVPLGLPRCRNIRVDKVRFLTTRKAQLDSLLVRISNVVPHAILARADHAGDGIRHQAKHPVEVVRAPVVGCAARDGVVRVPVAARVIEAAHKRFAVE